MKIDAVLEAHGIGIIQLDPPIEPTTGIITNGLIGYWNSLQGVDGTTWENIAPSTSGQYNATISGATVTESGMSFDGSNDSIQIPLPAQMRVVTSGTFEVRLRSNGGAKNLLAQTNMSIAWVESGYVVLSGVFDTVRNLDNRLTLNITPMGRPLYLTITADAAANRITAYLYNPLDGTTTTGTYTTTVGTFCDGETFLLGGGSHPFNGILDSVRIYNRVLTAAEIEQNREVGDAVGLPTAPINDVLFSDDFSGAALGQDWSMLDGNFNLYDGYIASTSANSRAIVTTLAEADNISIAANLTVNASEGLTVRAVNATNHIRVVLERNNRLVVSTHVNNVKTEISALTFPTPTARVNLKVELRGAQITVYVDDVQKIQTTSSHFLTANQHGVHSWTDSANRGRFYSFEIKALD